MRTALRTKAPRARVATPYPREAPVEGWVANENIADASEQSCYVLDNWFPEANALRVRNGSITFAYLPLESSIRTIMVYDYGGTTKIFATQEFTSIYDITNGPNLRTSPAAPIFTGQHSDQYITLNYSTAGGHFLMACNGADHPINYDGATFQNTPAITGVTGGDGGSAASLNYVLSYKSRLFFCQNNSLDVWYLPVDSIGGAAQKIALGGILKLGGTIIGGAAMLVNAATGPDDYVVFVSSEGEVAIYSGTNPGDPTAWFLKGLFRIGRPIGNRCLLQISGDIAVLCADGIVSLTKAIQLDVAASNKAAFSASISTAFSDQYDLTGGLFGWQLTSWPTGHMGIVNVPLVADVQSQQYVMNVLTGAWARYTGMNASCFALASQTMYFGTVDGRVVQFEIGNSDDGEDINAVAVPAYSYMRRPGFIKHIKNVQMFFKGTGNYRIGANIVTDFSLSYNEIDPQTIIEPGIALWDEALWDEALWPPIISAHVLWLGIAGSGYYIAPVIIVQTGDDSQNDNDCQFLAMNMLFEDGAVIG